MNDWQQQGGTNRKDFTQLLINKRPDLWAVSRMLKHCKDSPTAELRGTVWNGLTEEDQAILKSINAGRMPEGFKIK